MERKEEFHCQQQKQSGRNICYFSHLSLRDIKSAISGSTWYQIDHSRLPLRLQIKWGKKRNIFYFGREAWWAHYLGVTEEAGGDCWSSLSHSQLRTDWLRPTDEQAAPEKSQHHQGDVKCMIPSSPPAPHHTTPHHHTTIYHHSKQLRTTQTLTLQGITGITKNFTSHPDS